MGSEGSLYEAKEIVVTQVSFGGFDKSVTAKDLSDFLERQTGSMVWRCRLKTSWTPPGSYPDFQSDISKVKLKVDFDKVEPHAFVHFATPQAAKRAYNAAGQSALVLNRCPIKGSLGIESSFRVNRRRSMDPFKFCNVHVQNGSIYRPNELWIGWKGPGAATDFIIDPFDDTLKILFSRATAFSFRSTKEQALINCNFKLEFLVRDIVKMKLYLEQMQPVVLLELRHCPLVYYRTADDNIHETVPFDLLDDEDPWIRTTDFTPNGALGRCRVYRISFSPRFLGKLEKATAYLRERRLIEERPRLSLKVKDEADYGAKLSNLFYCVQDKQGISFDILFLVNALVHKGIINQHQLSEDFFGLLRSQKPELNRTALKHIYSYKRPLNDAYEKLKHVQEWLMNNPGLIKTTRVPDESMEVRRFIITPTTAYCVPPEVELSNRVLRNYRDVADRFLRITFMDEGWEQLNNSVLNFYVAPIVKNITSNSFMEKTSVYNRIKSILSEGFVLCGRKYSFLAFSSNQLRDQSAWFFAEDEMLKVSSILRWMGKFENRNVAKNAARMGLCFSSTFATVNVPSEKKRMIRDIKRNGHDFSDGIGKLSMELAMEIAEKLQLSTNPPSAYQIRYAGFKGVIASWPGNNDGYLLSMRRSMKKFVSNHTMVEVVSWTRFQPGFLNRQIVTLLSALNVPDDVFSKMQDVMVYRLNQILENADMAYEVVTTSCAEQGNTAAMMLSAGFRPQTEPHLRGMLCCVRSAQVGDLLHKARIFVPSGRWLMGCLDELCILDYGQCFIQVSIPSLESSFSKHGSRFSESKDRAQVITGHVVIAKNPCLHPGDIRILEAVDAPGLHHLVDCLVFPQKGDRPHTNEASGSDLDGDLYFVTWDKGLIPPDKKSRDPMDYTPGEVKEQPRQVTHEDIWKFFLRYLSCDKIGVISNAHVVHADLSDDGALDEKCLHLAELAAQAVDFPKTGKVVSMPHSLKPKVYPDFMGKDEFQSYKSKKILGKLYRKIRDTYNEGSLDEGPNTPEDVPYDVELEVHGTADFLMDAWNRKCSYDGALNALLGQYRLSAEEELVTGQIWSMTTLNSRKQGDLKERIKRAYSSLRKEFRNVFEAMGPEFECLTEEERSMLYEQKASAWYQVTYHPRWVKKFVDMTKSGGEGPPVRLSFAWIAADYLVRIKIRARGSEKQDASKPINSLANYIAERI